MHAFSIDLMNAGLLAIPPILGREVEKCNYCEDCQSRINIQRRVCGVCMGIRRVSEARARYRRTKAEIEADAATACVRNP